jgi:SCY1-like protein 1
VRDCVRARVQTTAPSVTQAPELAAGDWAALRGLPRTTVDAYALGVLILDAAMGPLRNSDDVATALGRVARKDAGPLFPPALSAVVTRLCGDSARTRLRDLSVLRDLALFKQPIVTLLQRLDNMPLMETGERATYLQSLRDQLPTLPEAVARYRVLPLLTTMIDTGVAGGAGALTLVLAIGSRLSRDEFDRTIVPMLVSQFASTDRATRLALLTALPEILERVPPSVIATVFVQLLNGFADAGSAVIREATVKAGVVLAPALPVDSRVTLAQHIVQRMQTDSELAIRVNATIALGRMASSFDDAAQRGDLLMGALMKQLRDVTPSRIAALKALAHCVTLDARVPVPGAVSRWVSVAPTGTHAPFQRCCHSGSHHPGRSCGRRGLALRFHRTVIHAPPPPPAQPPPPSP